jgi:replicative DNA helicase
MNNLSPTPQLVSFPGRVEETIANLEAEEAILGSIMLDPLAYRRVSAVLKSEHFYSTVHKQIYRAVKAIADDGKQTDDANLVYATLIDLGLWSKESSSVATLAQLVNRVISTANVDAYADLIIEKSQRRQLKVFACKLQDKAAERGPFKELMAPLFQELMAISGVSEKKWKSGDEIVDAFSAYLMDLNSGTIQPDITSIGIPGVDRLLGGGLEPGTVTFLGGISGSGKTAAMMQSIAAMCNSGVRVGLFSIEMNEFKLYRRLLASASGISSGQLRNMQISPEKMGLVMSCLADLKRATGRNLHVRYGGLSVEQFILDARAKIAEQNLQVIYLDNLHAFRGVTNNDFLADAAIQIRDLAHDTGIKLISLAQLNETTRSTTDKRPTMTSVRGANAVRDSADHIIAIHRPEMFDASVDRGIAEWINLKARDCEQVPFVRTLFNGQFVRFEEYKEWGTY